MPMDGRWRRFPATRCSRLAQPAAGPVAAPSRERARLRTYSRAGSLALALALVSAACFNEAGFVPLARPPAGDTDAESEGGDSETGSSTTQSDGSAGSGAAGPDLGAIQADLGGGSTTGDDPPPDAPAPTIDAFFATPNKVEFASDLIFTLECSDDVVSVEIVEDTLGTVATLTPADFPYAYLIASDAQNDHGRFTAIVRDAEGATASASTDVTIEVSAGGLEVWSAMVSDHPSEAFAAIPYEGGAIAVGYHLDGLYLRAEITRLDEHGVRKWTRVPELGPAYATGVALDAQGNLIVVGNRHVKDYQAMWIRTYDPAGNEVEGSAIFGAYGERALAVASTKSGFYVVGDVREPGSTARNLRFYGYVGDGFTKTWAGPEVDDAPAPDDQAFALAVLDDGDVAVVGSTQVLAKVNNGWVARPRAIVLRYTASGSLLGHWIDDDTPHLESQARSVATDREGGILVGGRTGPRLDGYGHDAYPVVYRLGPDLTPMWERIIPGGAFEASVNGVARSLAGDIVVAATVSGTDIFLGELDGQVGSGMESWSWKRTIDPWGLPDRLNTVALGPYGELFLAGMVTSPDEGPRAYVRRCTP